MYTNISKTILPRVTLLSRSSLGNGSNLTSSANVFRCHYCNRLKLLPNRRVLILPNGFISLSRSFVSGTSLKREIRAFSNILSKSGFRTNLDVLRLFGFDGSVTNRHRSFHTSAGCQQEQRQPSEDEDKDKDNDNKAPFLSHLMFWSTMMVIVAAVARALQGDDVTPSDYVSWNEFYHNMLAKGEVDQILVQPEAEVAIVKVYDHAVIKGRESEKKYYHMKIADPYNFDSKIRKAEAELGIKPEQGVPISYQRQSPWSPVIVTAVVISVLWLVFRKKLSNISLNMPSTDMFASERKAKFLRVDIMSQQGKGINFKDVAGLKEAKIEVMEFVDYMKSPQRFMELGAKIPRGALLLGPPGCGKTLLARAVASEAQVPFLAMAGSEFVEVVGGLGAARVRDLFKEAKKRAPCIIFLDEIDAIGRKRSGSSFYGSQEEEQTLNQLLVEMDGIEKLEGVVVLGATNRVDIIDKALLRPGRFDRHVMIDLPTMIERKELFDMYLGKLKLAQDVSVYSSRLAQMSPRMSGADIANITNEAAIHAARFSKKKVDVADFEYAVARVIAGPEKKTRMFSPSEKKVVAYHESGHALVGWLLKHTDALLRISIVPRTNSALGFAQYMPTDQHLYNTEELFERMCMALGGRAAEAVIFNHITTGAVDDLKKVTQMAYNQIRSYGMNEAVGYISFPPASPYSFGDKPYSKRLEALMDDEAKSLISRAYHHTEKLLESNKNMLHTLATNLLEFEELTYNDVERLIGPPPHGKKNTIEAHGWEGIMPENDSNGAQNNGEGNGSQNDDNGNGPKSGGRRRRYNNR